MRVLLAPALLLVAPTFAEKKVITSPGGVRSASPLSAAIEADGFLYVSGMVGRDTKGQFARGDVPAQTRQVLDNIGAALKAAGVDFRHVVSTTVYIADVRTLPEADSVYRKFFPSDFPARTVLESMLMAPEAIVEISAVAVKDLAQKRVLKPDGWAEPSGPFSHGVFGSSTLFLSSLQGQGDTIQAQTESVLNRQNQLLQAAGLAFGDLVSTRIYLADPAQYNAMNEIYRRFVTVAPPTRATVHAQPVEPGSMIHIASVAVRDSGRNRPTGEGWTSPIHSYAVQAGRRLYIAGMTGRTQDGKFAVNDIKAQTRQALASIDLQLKKFGMTFADAVDCVVWLRDARHFAQMNEVYREYVKPDPPARATVRIPPTSSEGLIEVMMIAAK